MFTSKKLKITATGAFAPSRVVKNEELENKVPTSAAWIEENLGIRERRIADENVYTSDLAAAAGAAALETANIDPQSIDLVIVATATPDRKAPSTACLTKHKLGITNSCPAFDLAAVCSGFVYGLSMASSLIESGAYKRILLVGADTFSKITDWTRRDCVFFGDGAGAVVIEASPTADGFFSAEIFADTRETDNFTVYPEDQFFTMNGGKVYEVGSSAIPEAVSGLLAANKLSTADIKWIVPHQPSRRLLLKSAERLQVPAEMVKMNMDRFANTSGATVPLLLDEVNRAGEISAGDLICFAAVGSGWTWGAALYRWQ